MTYLMCLFLAIFLFTNFQIDSLDVLDKEDIERFENCDGSDCKLTIPFPLETEQSCATLQNGFCLRMILKNKAFIEHINLVTSQPESLSTFIEREENNLTEYKNNQFYEEVDRIIIKSDNNVNLCRVKIFAFTEDPSKDFIERVTRKHLRNFEDCNGVSLDKGSEYPLENDGSCWKFKKEDCVLLNLKERFSIFEFSLVMDESTNSETKDVEMFLSIKDLITDEYQNETYNPQTLYFDDVVSIWLQIKENVSICWIKLYVFIDEVTITPPTILDKVKNIISGMKKFFWILILGAFILIVIALSIRYNLKDTFKPKRSKSSKPKSNKKTNKKMQVQMQMQLDKYYGLKYVKPNVEVKLSKRKLKEEVIEKNIEADLGKKVGNEKVMVKEIAEKKSKPDLGNKEKEEKLEKKEIAEKKSKPNLGNKEKEEKLEKKAIAEEKAKPDLGNKEKEEKLKKKEVIKKKDEIPKNKNLENAGNEKNEKTGKVDKEAKKNKKIDDKNVDDDIQKMIINYINEEPKEKLDRQKKEQKVQNKMEFEENDDEIDEKNEDEIENVELDTQNENDDVENETFTEEPENEVDILEKNLKAEANIKNKNEDENKEEKDKGKNKKTKNNVIDKKGAGKGKKDIKKTKKK